jgi:hypothetical protein
MANPSALGSDISGVDDLDFALSVVSGRLALAQSILRRITSPRGSLLGSPAYGYSMFDTIGSSVPASVVEQRVLEQVLAEQEVEDARVTASLVNGVLTVTIAVVDGDGPFTLTVSASELTAQAMIDQNPPFWKRV